MGTFATPKIGAVLPVKFPPVLPDFFTDFEHQSDLELWTVNNIIPCTWGLTIDDVIGKPVLQATMGADGDAGLYITGPIDGVIHQVESMVRLVDADILANVQGGIVFRFTDVNNFYALRIVDAGATERLGLYKYFGGTPSGLLAGYSFSVDANVWYRIKVIVTPENGNVRIIGYLNDIERINYLDTASIPPISGRAGLWASWSANSRIRFKNFSIRR